MTVNSFLQALFCTIDLGQNVKTFNFHLLIKHQSCHHMETSKLICSANGDNFSVYWVKGRIFDRMCFLEQK